MSHVRQRVRSQRSDVVFNIILYTVCALLLLIVLYPLWFIVIASLSDPSAVASGHVWVLPVGFTLDGYAELLKQTNVWVGYRNTIAYTLVGTLIALAVNIPAAYALSRKDLVGRKVLMGLYAFTMFFSGGLIPTFLTVQQFRLYNTFWVMVLPFSVSVYNIIVARTFFQNIPESMEESAIIDGAGDWTIYARIIMPLSKAVIAVITLYYAVGHWNSWFNAMIFLRDRTLYPLQLFLRELLILNNSANEASSDFIELSMARDLVKYCTIIVSTVPILLVYPFAQRYFVQGVMIGAVKG